jgi:PKHD-type hydroxylase
MWQLHTHKVNSYCYYENAFDADQVEGIIRHGNGLDMSPAKVGGAEDKPGGAIVEDIRKTEIAWIHPSEDTAWLYRILTDHIHKANQEWFQFDLDTIEALQYSVYNPGGFYDKHVDMHHIGPGKTPRKLSFTVQLSDPSEYEGGDMLIHNMHNPWPIAKQKGGITFFPSYVLHEVTPVTKGTRKALVGWILGPAFK